MLSIPNPPIAIPSLRLNLSRIAPAHTEKGYPHLPCFLVNY
jgi:hypothetical protein